MSLSHDEIARLSQMSLDELHAEVGRTVYADRLGKKVITGEQPLSYHVKTVTREGADESSLWHDGSSSAMKRETCSYDEISDFQI